MKKLLAVLVLILVLSLSGCQESYYQECINSGGQEVFTKGINTPQCIMPSEQDNYYTKEEVDELLAEDSSQGAANDLYVMALIEDDFYTKEEVDQMFEDYSVEIFEDYLNGISDDDWARVVDDVLEENGFYYDFNGTVDDYIEQYFEQMMLGIIENLNEGE